MREREGKRGKINKKWAAKCFWRWNYNNKWLKWLWRYVPLALASVNARDDDFNWKKQQTNNSSTRLLCLCLRVCLHAPFVPLPLLLITLIMMIWLNFECRLFISILFYCTGNNTKLSTKEIITEKLIIKTGFNDSVEISMQLFYIKIGGE